MWQFQRALRTRLGGCGIRFQAADFSAQEPRAKPKALNQHQARNPQPLHPQLGFVYASRNSWLWRGPAISEKA